MMLQFTEKEITEQVENHLEECVIALQPVGNHHLKRHLVYKVTLASGAKVVYKVYYKTNRRIREIATLKHLAGSLVRCPTLLKYGNLTDGTEWLLMTALDGMPFEQVYQTMDHFNQMQIFREMGEELGKLHSYTTFDFYGQWDEEGRPLGVQLDYAVGFHRNLDFEVQEIERQQLPEKELLLEASRRVRDHADLLTNVKEYRLVHNDFDGRNVLVHQRHGAWELSGVIDFESGAPGHREKDFISLYHKYFLDHPAAERAFFASYTQYCTVEDAFFTRLPVYMLKLGVGICSWANEQAPEYYVDGVVLVKRFLEQVPARR